MATRAGTKNRELVRPQIVAGTTKRTTKYKTTSQMIDRVHCTRAGTTTPASPITSRSLIQATKAQRQTRDLTKDNGC